MSYALRKQSDPLAADAVERLIHTHLPLVRRLAWHVHGRIGSPDILEDLMQAGMIALVESAQAYEDRGFGFPTYASVRIKGAMIDHLRRTSGQSRGAASTRRAIEAARRSIENTKLASATSNEIAERLAVPVSIYHQMVAVAQSITVESLDHFDTDTDPDFSDTADLPTEIIDRTAQEARLAAQLDSLDDRSRTVLQLYFYEELNLEEIGHVLNVGAARVCQIKKAALEKLRERMPIR